jgi:signal peptidase I
VAGYARPQYQPTQVQRVQEELVAWLKTLFSAAVYAILIVTFGFQVARVEGQSMAHTLEDQDRLIVNKLVYRISEPRRGDIVMLYYPLNPDKSFREAGDCGGRRQRPHRGWAGVCQRHPAAGRLRLGRVPQPRRLGSADHSRRVLLRDGRSSEQQLRQPSLGMVPKRYIIGKVQLRWWPVPTARVF